MFVDASAIIAILARESDAASLAARLGQAVKVYLSPIVAYEATLGLARVGSISLVDARMLLNRFLEELPSEIIPITVALSDKAIEAFARFGKGRHVAGLNMGDCFAYACAQSLSVPLLFKGDDFPRTDIAVA